MIGKLHTYQAKLMQQSWMISVINAQWTGKPPVHPWPNDLECVPPIQTVM